MTDDRKPQAKYFPVCVLSLLGACISLMMLAYKLLRLSPNGDASALGFATPYGDLHISWVVGLFVLQILHARWCWMTWQGRG